MTEPKLNEIWTAKITDPFTNIEYIKLLKYEGFSRGIPLWSFVDPDSHTLRAGRYDIEPIERIEEAQFPNKGKTALELLKKGAKLDDTSGRLWDSQEWRDEVLHFLSRI